MANSLLSTTSATAVVDHYCQSWSESSSDRRHMLLTQVWGVSLHLAQGAC